jgi:CubicO group peptidase (beta-lactamase class C family)
MAVGEPTPPFWSYTNVGWSLLGRAQETLTGQTWESAMRASLLDRYAMTQTTFTTRPAEEPRASGHQVTATGVVPVTPWAPLNLAPAGSTLLSTATDLLRLAGAHLDDPPLEAMRQEHADVQIYGWLDAWCLGWGRHDWAGGPVWGWDGISAGQRSVLSSL